MLHVKLHRRIFVDSRSKPIYSASKLCVITLETQRCFLRTFQSLPLIPLDIFAPRYKSPAGEETKVSYYSLRKVDLIGSERQTLRGHRRREAAWETAEYPPVDAQFSYLVRFHACVYGMKAPPVVCPVASKSARFLLRVRLLSR